MEHDDQVAKQVAEECLRFKIYFNEKERVVMELGEHKWIFNDKTDAEAIERISQIFTSVSKHMWEIINEKVLHWVSENKKSFN
jgi:hypothetical protein